MLDLSSLDGLKDRLVSFKKDRNGCRCICAPDFERMDKLLMLIVNSPILWTAKNKISIKFVDIYKEKTNAN